MMNLLRPGRLTWADPSTGRSHPRWLVDSLLAAGLLALQLLGMLAVGGPAARWATQPGALAMVTAGCGLLVLRRRLPVAVLAAQAVLVLGQALAGWPLLSAPAFLVAVSTVALAGQRAAAASGGIAVVVLLASIAMTRMWTAASVLTAVAFCVAATTTGMYVSAMHGWRIEARERRARQGQERQLRAEAAVVGERVRIARELHDIVAHHLSLVVLQAAAARATLPDDGPAISAVEAAESASRRALDEMRRMVGVLRLGDTGVVAERVPQPSLRDLSLLVDQAGAAGVTVDLSVEGDLRNLPDGIDLCAYRIVQEALTNVIRHAGGAPARVTIRRGPDRLELAVADRGAPRPEGAVEGGGLGLVGMRERVALLGGQLSAGPQPTGGWAVWASIPAPQPRL